MKVYSITSMYHYDDYKRAETTSRILKITRDEESAYMFAHNNQLEVMGRYIEKEPGEEYKRVDGEPWVISYHKLIEHFDNLLCEPQFTMMASQHRYLVEEHMVE
ncbi:hypothetical protein BGX31_010449 [Mortierella sp. GBA43]|nr:hypothetical protein BGX31_010449 [Mortierella sp. GBA43]